MFKTILFCFFVINTVSASNSRVVNGTDAEEGEFPYAVSLRIRHSHACGGTILNEKYILTAAHCVCDSQTPQNSSIFSIQYDLLSITKEVINVIPVKKIYCGQFSSKKLIFDSAILEELLITNKKNDIPIQKISTSTSTLLENAIPKGKWKPVQIAKDFSTMKKQTGSIIGWGKLSHNGPLSKNLQKLKVEIYDDKTCGKRFDIKHHICFGAEVGGACSGDSGTALIVDGVQVGIASFITDLCGIANQINPNVYSRISTYYDWIQQITEI